MSNLPVVPNAITAEEIKKALPVGVNLAITPDLLNHINGLLKDEKLQQNFQENLISFTEVLRQGKFSAQAYIQAVEYVSRKLMGDTNEIAYSKVFPDRYNRLLLMGKPKKEISAYVSAYHNNKLVGLILAQSLTPAWIHNQVNMQKAINKQVQLMEDPKASHMVQHLAANSIMTHLKQPEVAKVELDIAVTEDNSLSDLREAMKAFTQKQREAIINKDTGVEEVAASRIVPKETDIVIDSN